MIIVDFFFITFSIIVFFALTYTGIHLSQEYKKAVANFEQQSKVERMTIKSQNNKEFRLQRTPNFEDNRTLILDAEKISKELMDQEPCIKLKIYKNEDLIFEMFLTEPITSVKIGRDSSNDIQLNDAVISRLHAVVTKAGDKISINDCSSKNGTFLNGEKVTTSTSLVAGDEIILADEKWRLVLE